jgi:hypothetical protein
MNRLEGDLVNVKREQYVLRLKVVRLEGVLEVLKGWAGVRMAFE